MPRPETPSLTVDIIITLSANPEEVVLIERKYPPFGWALPGGFVDVGEKVEAAAVREAKEETCLDVQLQCLLGIYSDPGRDDRGHTVSAVYIATASGSPKAEDDAKNIGCFFLDKLPTLAFDHAQILRDYQQYLATGQLPSVK